MTEWKILTAKEAWYEKSLTQQRDSIFHSCFKSKKRCESHPTEGKGGIEVPSRLQDCDLIGV